MTRDPDCNRTDLDDEGDAEEIDFSECVNTFQLEEGEDDEDN